MHVMKAVTLLRPIDEVYRFWLDPQNMPRFVRHLHSIESRGDRLTWRTKDVDGSSAEWDVVVTEQVPNELIAWHAVKGSDVTCSGAVYFTPAPGDRGTEVRVTCTFDQPGGKVAAFFQKLLGEDPATEIGKDLHRFKQVMETGELVHSDASIHEHPHPARPAGADELVTAGRSEGGRP